MFCLEGAAQDARTPDKAKLAGGTFFVYFDLRSSSRYLGIARKRSLLLGTLLGSLVAKKVEAPPARGGSEKGPARQEGSKKVFYKEQMPLRMEAITEKSSARSRRQKKLR